MEERQPLQIVHRLIPTSAALTGLLLATAGCNNDMLIEDTAALAIRVVSPPVAHRFFFPTPPSGGQELWNVTYEVEIRETSCVAANLTFVEIQIFDESLRMNFGGLPRNYDQGELVREGLSQLPACRPGAVLRGTLGNIGGLGDNEPKGPVKVIVRAIGADEHGHGIGIDTSVESPLQVVR